jgi:hypothetical protein
VSGVALVLSFTRAAWIGAGIGLGTLLFLGRRSQPIRWRRVATALSVVVGSALVLAVLPGDTATLLRFKVANLFNLSSPTVSSRLLSSALALDHVPAHPVLGSGTYTFAPLVAGGTDFARFDGWRNLWIGNYLLLALHDTGVAGLLLWCGMLGSLVLAGWRTARGASGADLSVQAGALTMSVVTLMVAFLATSGFSLGYPWLIMGILGAQRRLAVAHTVEEWPDRNHVPLQGARAGVT